MIARPPLAWRVPPRPPPPSTTLPISLSPVASQGFSSGIMSSIIARERQISVRDNRASHLLCSPPACLLADSTQMDATYLTDAASTRKQASTKLKATRNHTCMRAYQAGRQEESVPRAGAVVVPCRAGGSGPGDGEISLLSRTQGISDPLSLAFTALRPSGLLTVHACLTSVGVSQAINAGVSVV